MPSTTDGLDILISSIALIAIVLLLDYWSWCRDQDQKWLDREQVRRKRRHRDWEWWMS